MTCLTPNGIIRPVVPGCAGCAMAHPDFGRSVNPISIRGDRLCPSNYYWHTRIFRPSDGPVMKCQTSWRSVFSHLRIIDFVFSSLLWLHLGTYSQLIIVCTLILPIWLSFYNLHIILFCCLMLKNLIKYVHIFSVAQTPNMLCGEIKNHY